MYDPEKLKDPRWLAGFFDGEGCICCTHKYDYRYRNTTYQIYVSITQKNTELLYALQDMYGGDIDKICVRWWGHSAKPLLELILPYVIIKHDQIIAALDFIETMSSKKHPNLVSGEMNEKRGQIYQILKGAKHAS